MLNEQERIKAEESVRTIMKAAMVSIFAMDTCDEELLERLEQTAERLQKTFGLDGDIMDEYRSKVESAKEVRRITSQLYPAEAKQVQDTIYEMCGRLDDSKEVMRHVKTASEILDIWDMDN